MTEQGTTIQARTSEEAIRPARRRRRPSLGQGWRRAASLAVIALLYTAIIGGLAIDNLDVSPDNCASRAATGFGDGTAGGVWLTYLFDENQVGPGDGFATVTGPRGGEVVWTPEAWSQTLMAAPMWAFSRFLGPVCSFNLSVATGFAVSALAMASLAYYLTRRFAIAAVAGYVFSFSSLAIGKSTGHVAYVHQWPFPLLIFGILWMWRSKSKRAAVFGGAVLGLAPWVDGYYLPFAWITAAVLLAALLILNRSEVSYASLVQRIGLLVGTGVTFQAPLVYLVKTGGSTGSNVTRPFVDSVGQFDVYGARPQDFVTPDARSIFHGLIEPREGVIEANVSIGLSLIAIALVGFGYSIITRRKSGPASAAVAFLPALTISAPLVAYMCGPARPQLLGIELPNPFGLIAGFVPLWRVPSRMGITVTCLVIAAAAITAHTLIQACSSRKLRIGMACVLAVVVGLDHVHEPSGGYARFDYSQVPPGYVWLSTLDDVDRIVEYPTTDPNAAFSTFQVVHRKNMVNSKMDYQGGYAVNQAIAGLGDTQTPALLRHYGADLVLAHPTLMGVNNALLSDQYQLVNEYNPGDVMPRETPVGRNQVNQIPGWYDMDVYRLSDGPEATGIAEFGDGWHPIDVQGYFTSRWSSSGDSTLVPRAFTDASRCHITLDLLSLDRARDVTITQDSSALWSGQISENHEIEFEALCGEPVNIATAGPLTAIAEVNIGSTDPRSVGLLVTNPMVNARN